MILIKLLFFLVGIFTILGLCYAMSSNRKAIRIRTLLWGIGLQFMFGVIVLYWEPGRIALQKVADAVTNFLGFASEGSKFLFGNLSDPSFASSFGFQFAIIVLPTIIFFSAVMSLAYHYKIMQRIVAVMAWGMSKTMGTSGAESLCAAANVFVGQTEAPLVVRPYISKMTMSEINAVMVAGFGTIAGGVMAGIIGMGVDARYVITASFMAAPASLLVAKILYPETETSETAQKMSLNIAPRWSKLTLIILGIASVAIILRGIILVVLFYFSQYFNLFFSESLNNILEILPYMIIGLLILSAVIFLFSMKIETEIPTKNGLEAAAKGASDGMQLCLNVAAMLVAFIALVKLLDACFAGLDYGIDGCLLRGAIDIRTNEYIGIIPGSLKTLFSNILWPLAFLMGVPQTDCGLFSYLIGMKISLNEFYAYSELTGFLQTRYEVMADLPTCGFGQVTNDLVSSGNFYTLPQFFGYKAEAMATFALCGFANFSSIAIQIGGISPMVAPDQQDSLRYRLSRLGIRAMLGGALVSLLTATIAGFLL